MKYKSGDIVKVVNKGKYKDKFIAKVMGIIDDGYYSLKALLVIKANTDTNYDTIVSSVEDDKFYIPTKEELELAMVENNMTTMKVGKLYFVKTLDSRESECIGDEDIILIKSKYKKGNKTSYEIENIWNSRQPFLGNFFVNAYPDIKYSINEITKDEVMVYKL